MEQWGQRKAKLSLSENAGMRHSVRFHSDHLACFSSLPFAMEMIMCATGGAPREVGSGLTRVSQPCGLRSWASPRSGKLCSTSGSVGWASLGEADRVAAWACAAGRFRRSPRGDRPRRCPGPHATTPPTPTAAIFPHLRGRARRRHVLSSCPGERRSLSRTVLVLSCRSQSRGS